MANQTTLECTDEALDFIWTSCGSQLWSCNVCDLVMLEPQAHVTEDGSGTYCETHRPPESYYGDGEHA